MELHRYAPVLACLVLSVASTVAWAEGQVYQPDITILQDDIRYVVQQDGQYVQDESLSILLNDDQGVKKQSQIPLRFSSAMQSLDIIEAYTLTRAGQRISVPAENQIIQQSPQSVGAPMFDDDKVKVVVFPATEVGARLFLHFRRTQKVPLFAGVFSLVASFPKTMDYRSASIRVDAPASMKLNQDVQSMLGGESHPSGRDRRVWQWQLQPTPVQPPEPNSVSAFDFSPHVVVSSFRDYQALGDAYLARARPKAVVTPYLRALADQITGHLVGRREQANALYDWVTNEIRYVGVFFGTGGVVPHDAESIAKNRYGDCKDHAVLLEALLSAKGIKSSPVLLNVTDSYVLPTVAAVSNFNHAISYLPEFQLFADSTSAVARFGVLPLSERGKRALVTDDGSGHSVVMTLPAMDVSHDQVRTEMTFRLQTDGSIQGESRSVHQGAFDWLGRIMTMSVPKGMAPQLASKLLTLSGQHGSGSFDFLRVHDLQQDYTLTSTFRLVDAVSLPGPGAFALPQGLGSPVRIAAFADQVALPSRVSPSLFVNGRREEVTRLFLPAELQVTRLPNAIDFANALGRYHADYVRHGDELTVTRVLDLFAPSPSVSVADYPVARALGEVVMHDLKRQIVYQ